MTRKPSKQSDATPAAQVAHLMGEMTEVALAGQVVGLKILAAKMEDAEIEADFDNMPV
jgi:hypothetical protein